MGDAQSIPTPAQLADDLEASSTSFWQKLAEMEAEEIESAKLGCGWSAKSLVAHVAFWDDYQHRRMEAALAGISAAAGFARPRTDNDARAVEDASRSWIEIEQAAKQARQQLSDFARNLSPDALALEYPEGDKTLSILKLLQHMAHHLRVHEREIEAYCGSLERWGRAGLRKLMVEQPDNFMNGMAGLTEETMVTTKVCGEWSIRDVYAHVLSWNQYNAKLLRFWPQPDAETISEWARLPGDNDDTVNARLMAARAHLTMIDIADSLETEFRRILRVYDRKKDADLHGEGLTWNGPGIMSHFFYDIFLHEAEHAAQIWAYRAGVAEAESKRSSAV